MTDAVDNAPKAGESTNPDLKWYVVHAYSGMEKAVERNIIERIQRAEMQSKFGRILVPTEEVVEMKNGQRRTTERKFFPGYVLVEMVMDDLTWHLVKHTNKVTGFVGGAKTVLHPFQKKTFARSLIKCKKALKSPATRWSLKWANMCASKKARSRTSTAQSKKSITRKTKCVWRLPFLVARHP